VSRRPVVGGGGALKLYNMFQYLASIRGRKFIKDVTHTVGTVHSIQAGSYKEMSSIFADQ
jgi:hypothetical protein